MDFDFYTKEEINAMLNGLKFDKISQAEFDAITVKDPNTIYYVYDDNGNITQYMGNAEMTSGSQTAVSVIQIPPAVISQTAAGVITESEE